MTAIARRCDPPASAGAKARALRAAMFDALGHEDVAAAVAAVTARAKAGDAAAAKLFFSLLGVGT